MLLCELLLALRFSAVTFSVSSCVCLLRASFSFCSSSTCRTRLSTSPFRCLFTSWDVSSCMVSSSSLS